MNKYYHIFLKKKVKETCKKFNKVLEEYNKENNTYIDFKTFFIDILNYTEEDYNNFIISINKRKEKKSNHIPKINPEVFYKRMSKVGKHDHPEYEKYFKIVEDFRLNYINNNTIEDKDKTLRAYMKYKFNLEGVDALTEMRKITDIIYKKK